MQNSSFQRDLRSMSILHYALLAGILLFAGVTYFLLGPTMHQPGQVDESLATILRYLVPGLAIMAILVGRLVGSLLLKRASEEEFLAQKLAIYRTVALIRWSLMEGASLFAVTAYLLTGNQVFIMVALAGAAYLFTQKPTADLIGRELGLDPGQRRKLEN